MKSWLPHLVLLVIIIIASGMLWFDREIHDTAPLTALVPAQVNKIVVTSNNHETLRFQQNLQGTWWMHEPFNVPARAFRVNQITEIVSALSHAKIGANGLVLKDFGLQSPASMWQLNDVSLSFGGIEPLSGQRYTQIDDTIHLMTDRFYHLTLDPPTDFISLALLPPNSELYELILPAGHLKYEQDKWKVLLGAPDVRKLADAWHHSQALDVLPYQPKPSPTLVKVRLTKEDLALTFEYTPFGEGGLLGRSDIGVMYKLSEATCRALGLK